MIKKSHLPYFKVKKRKAYSVSSLFLLCKFLPCLKRKSFCHYLVTQDPRLYLKFIKKTSKNNPYFLRFDIKKYFPSINHHILLAEIGSNYQQLTGKSLSRRFKRILKKDLPQFLRLSPYFNQGLAIGNPLSYILAGIYLLRLDLALPVLFLRFNDDYLLFGKNKGQLEDIMRKVIIPILNKLCLTLNIDKLKSGKFHQDKVSFLGFEFYAGYIRVSEEKIEQFKQRIKKLTYLTRKKSHRAVIKSLNNQILGFGHYYKFASCLKTFQDLDCFIRARIKRYILRQRDLKPKIGNLLLTNKVLKNLKLKSLLEIKQKFDEKNKQKNRKLGKIKDKTGSNKKNRAWLQLEEISDRYRQKQILEKVSELTSIARQMEKKLKKIEKKLESLEKRINEENKAK
jgi:hypothetical protein